MPPRGAKPKQKSAKILQGTFRKDRDNPNAPKQVTGKPDARLELGKRERFWFDDTVALMDGVGLASQTFVGAIELLACLLAEFEKLRKRIDETGMFYESETAHGVLQRSVPAVGQMNTLRRQIQSLYGELGLTPTTICRVHGDKKGKKSEWDGF